ncbi:hypothetical protein SAMN06297358_1653 [Pedobacter xixiisoli]|uniref:Uncharacterized protein n=1 Tax=Pedobacter xixiisoli TaxID=1476464 RepID=A0A285ZY71_9SPHI|nr:hypothetical protein SAMN06297358_1653 [Pedobacter xixiisoli]
MKTIKRKQETVKNEKLWKGFYSVAFFIGLVLFVFEITIYRKTIIDVYIPILIILVVGLLTFYFNRNHYKKTYSFTGIFFSSNTEFIFLGFYFLLHFYGDQLLFSRQNNN